MGHVLILGIAGYVSVNVDLTVKAVNIVSFHDNIYDRQVSEEPWQVL